MYLRYSAQEKISLSRLRATEKILGMRQLLSPPADSMGFLCLQRACLSTTMSILYIPESFRLVRSGMGSSPMNLPCRLIPLSCWLKDYGVRFRFFIHPNQSAIKQMNIKCMLFWILTQNTIMRIIFKISISNVLQLVTTFNSQGAESIEPYNIYTHLFFMGSISNFYKYLVICALSMTCMITNASPQAWQTARRSSSVGTQGRTSILLAVTTSPPSSSSISR